LVGGRAPTVALAEEADEERTAAVDFVETDVERALGLGLLLRDAPTEIDVVEVEAALAAALAQLGEHVADEVVALAVHVAEGGRHEHAHGAPLAAAHLLDLLLDAPLLAFVDLALLGLLLGLLAAGL